MRVITVHKSRPVVFDYLGWQLFWLAVVLCLYWPGIVILPKNDHPVFMLGRQLAANDWEWFRSLLSYNRTRVLLPGDYFAFRPLMIAIIGLEDICFRNQLVVQGIISCTLFSFAATAFFMLLKRLAGWLPALAVTCLWVAQDAGAEIVLWQHINPYVLAPAFLCLAAYGLDQHNLTMKRDLATVACILLACLTHEMAVMIAGGMALLALCLGGVHNPFARRVTNLYLLAALVAVALNLADYLFIHPPPALLGPADSFKSVSPALFFNNLFQLCAAIGMANFLPGAVHLELRGDFFQIWKFWSESAVALWTGAILATVVTVAALFKSIRHSRRSGFNYDCYLYLFFVLLLGGAFGVVLFRTLSRGIDYMAGAGYYFSLTSLALCGILGLFIAQLKSRRLARGVCAAILLLALWQGARLRGQLLRSEPEKRALAAEISEIRSTLRQDPALCFGGMDPTETSIYDRNLTPLFWDLACIQRPNAEPLYGTRTAAGLVLTRLSSPFAPRNPPLSARRSTGAAPEKSAASLEFANLPIGQALEFSIRCAAPLTFNLESQGEEGGFYIDQSLIYQSAGAQARLSNFSNYTLLDGYVKFTISYSGRSIHLRANNILIGVLPDYLPERAKALTLTISSRDETRPLYLNGFRLLAGARDDTLSRAPLAQP